MVPQPAIKIFDQFVHPSPLKLAGSILSPRKNKGRQENQENSARAGGVSSCVVTFSYVGFEEYHRIILRHGNPKLTKENSSADQKGHQISLDPGKSRVHLTLAADADNLVQLRETLPSPRQHKSNSPWAAAAIVVAVAF